MGEGLTCITEFLGKGRRKEEVPLEQHFVTGHPCHFVGSQRTALYLEQVTLYDVSTSQV